MARLARKPDAPTIAACRGVLDFYGWKGLHVVRRWPRYHARRASEAERKSQEELAASTAIGKWQDTALVALWALHAHKDGSSWLDAQRASCRGKSWLQIE